MRLPWISRRSAGHATGGAAASAAGDGTQSDALPVGRSEWRDAGRLRPSFAADPGVRIKRFGDELAGSHLPEPILRPLGHERTADGPAGLVSGLTRPVIARVTSGSGGTQSLPLVHRRAHADVPDAAGVEDGSTVQALPELTIRHVPVITDDPVPGASLTSAGPADRRVVSGQAAGALQRAATDPVGVPSPLTTTRPSAGDMPGTIVGPSPVASRTILRTPGRSRVRLGPPISSETAPGTNPVEPRASSHGSVLPSVSAATRTHPTSTAAQDAPLAGLLRPQRGWRNIHDAP